MRATPRIRRRDVACYFSTVCAALLFLVCAIPAGAQSPVSVGYQKRIQLPIAGATAAYSLDSTVVDASAANGVVEVLGKAPGSTNIVVVTPAGVQTLAITVPVPPPVLPPGFEPPEHMNAAEIGNYEFRYKSDPPPIPNPPLLKTPQEKKFN